MTTALVDILPAHTGVAHEVRRGLVRVVERFERQLDSRLEPVNELCRYIERYRGKMLRPMLVLVSGMASGLREVNEAHITIGAVIEMIHVATLVHDDVLDDAEVRRGSATVNHMHGTEVSVILGDYLISKSFHLCSQLDTQAAALRVGEVTSRVCEGELLQLAHRGDFALDERTYFEIIGGKTACLIGLACEMGAQFSGADDETIRGLGEFGTRVGLAFQITDDLLDLVGDEETVGKSLGKDIEKGKLTLPMIHHLASLDARERGVIVESLSRGGAGDAGARRALIERLHRTGSVAYARARAGELIGEAKALLGGLEESGARAYLLDAADAVLTRRA